MPVCCGWHTGCFEIIVARLLLDKIEETDNVLRVTFNTLRIMHNVYT